MQKHSVIGLIVATMAEAGPFLNNMSLKRVESAVFPVYENEHLVLVVSGIGKANGAMATAYCCTRFEPVCICNLGAAGATGNAVLGEVYGVGEIIEYDRPKFKTGNPHLHRPNVLSGFAMKTLATQDKPVVAAADREAIATVADLVDMEAASVVQTSKKFGVDCYVFKYVTDTPENETHRDVVANVKKYVDGIYDVFHNRILPAF
ncbi:MAG: 5'-methylthioadenosine/S-adenosylhomocysteine nucleosidase [Proteobacteria bacterium]|nr:5'-methylthioadenosine/S-adenosylhomocysteine nucleosidase [Pseudomonadota bacterium]